MKRQKDIFDLIRDNQHKLEERPSMDAWDRLEERLDQQAPPERTISRFYRQLAMAASILFLIGMVSFISLYLRQEKPSFSEAKNINSSPVSPVPQQFEELTDTDRSAELYNMVAYQGKLNKSPRNIIQEGAPNKKLVAQRDIISTKQIAKNKQIAQLNKSEQKRFKKRNTENLANADLDIAYSSKDQASSYSAKVDDNIANKAEMEMEEKIAINAPPTPPQNANMEMEDVAIITEAAPPPTAPSTSVAAASKAKEYKNTAEKPRAKKEANYQTQANGKAATTMDSEATIVMIENDELSQFSWMLGEWTGTTGNGPSFETWQQVDPLTFKGKGWIVKNGETTFSENMTIQTIDNNLYYILALDDQGNPIKYKFKSYQGSQAIFENKTVDFPKQVVLERQGNLNFKTILQNSAPTQINESQNNYFQNRNTIRQEQVERSLQKID